MAAINTSSRGIGKSKPLKPKTYEQISKKTTSKQYVQDRSTYQINLLVTSVNFNSCIAQYNYLLDETMEATLISKSIEKIISFIRVIQKNTKKKITFDDLKSIIIDEDDYDRIIEYSTSMSMRPREGGKSNNRKYTRQKAYKKKNRTRRYNK